MNYVRGIVGLEYLATNAITGEGIGVGVLDSGVYRHPDLENQIIAFRDFTREGESLPYDDSGHGTHVCGIIAGSGRLSNYLYKGIAPKASLYVGKVIDRKGEGSLKTLIRGMEWLLYMAEKEPIRIINISISSMKFSKKEEADYLYQLFHIAMLKGIAVVTAAGNNGPRNRSVSKIGDHEDVICVGCYDDANRNDNQKSFCQSYSGRGPGSEVYRKPDLVAPGNIVSLGNANDYVRRKGTSMATPVVSGAIALYYQKYPADSVYHMKYRLLHSCEDLGENYMLQGYGRLNIREFIS